MADPHENLAEQALANLVNQFARPLDFLRELVQNSIDAGSPRIEVRVEYTAPKPGETDGVTEIHVEDWGEGMDEEIIDNQLTRLFASAKEGDLTKIGKFGIGFTSIFAINPEAILLRTGRHGENWELLFDRDRSFLKTRIEAPVDGTKITLFKRMPPAETERFVEEARFILTYWCEHSNVPITFWDRTQGGEIDEVEGDDPFAAFESEASAPEASSGPESVNHPLGIEADLVVRRTEGDVEAVVGISDQPLYGYYNGGLTLLRTRSIDALGRHEYPLRHLVFKVKNDALEHTLTRDNVLQDSHWEHVMKVVLAARDDLVQALIAKLAEVLEQGGDPERWQAHLARLSELDDVRDAVLAAEKSPMFRTCLGQAVSLKAVVAQEGALQFVMVGAQADALVDGLAEQKRIVLQDTPATRSLLLAAQKPPVFEVLASPREIRRADEAFVLPQLMENSDLDDQERKLLAKTEELLLKACGRGLSVRIGDFGGTDDGRSVDLMLNGPKAGGVFQRKTTWASWIKEVMLGWRCMLINRHHPLFRAQLLASIEDPWLAAAGLASALLHTEDIERSKTHRLLLTLANQRLSLSA